MAAKTIAIFSTKGGVGKTLIAANLAAVLAKEENKRVALVDLDLQVVGDMARMLDLNPANCILDRDAKGAVIRHPLGLDFIAGILKPRQASRIEPKMIDTAFAQITPLYDFIIVDAGRAFTDTLISVFNNSNLILFVVAPDVLSIYQTKWALDTLQELHFPLKMIKVVLNRAESPGGISWQEIKAALPCEIISRVPSEGKVVILAINRKSAVVVDSPRSKVSQAIRELAGSLLRSPDIFMRHQDVAELRSGKQEQVMDKEGEFWSSAGLVEKPEAVPTREELARDEVVALKMRVHDKLVEKLDLKHLDINVSKDPVKFKQLREKTEKVIANAISEETGAFISSYEVRKRLIKEIADEALGLGPLEDLIADPEITDILVNNKDQVYIERRGKLELSPKRFISNEQVRQTIERIVAPLGRRIDESVPMVDARLADGSRVNAIIPPLSLTGPMLTIRKFGRERFTVPKLMDFNTLNQPMAQFLQACVVSRKNMVVSGGTGSGKTTVLNALSQFIPENERIITIEDAAELKLNQEHWARLESRPPNIEGRGAVTTRDLFRNTLRMRPDRIIIGECRGAESLDMLQAMNTGHDGSMTTIHANSTHDVLSRLDSMILMSGAELPIRAIREMIASAINVIVHTARLPDGTRKVMQITQIMGMLDEMHIGLKDIFVFKQTGVGEGGKALGDFKPTGFIPTFLEDIHVRGIALPEEIFKA